MDRLDAEEQSADARQSAVGKETGDPEDAADDQQGAGVAVHTDAAEEAGGVSVRVIGSAEPVRVIICPTPSRGMRVERGLGLSGTSGSPGPLHLTL